MVSRSKCPAFWKVPFLDLASSVWSMPKEEWISDSPTLKDIAVLEKEADGISNIDDTNLRTQMIHKWKRHDGGIELFVNELPGRTRVLFLGTKEQRNMVPWAFWARVFQAIGHSVSYTLLYAHPSLRDFPQSNKVAIGPSNINAGYSFLCKQDIVVIYRFEEATRVLLHELLHTACFDFDKKTVDLETNTEAWTEVLLCALLSRGSLKDFDFLWKQQTAWIQSQSQELQARWNVRGPSDYAWRYMVGKEKVLREKGFLESSNMFVTNVGLRFTTPQWDSFLYEN